jgi:hypothetical protein
MTIDRDWLLILLWLPIWMLLRRLARLEILNFR